MTDNRLPEGPALEIADGKPLRVTLILSEDKPKVRSSSLLSRDTTPRRGGVRPFLLSVSRCGFSSMPRFEDWGCSRSAVIKTPLVQFRRRSAACGRRLKRTTPERCGSEKILDTSMQISRCPSVIRFGGLLAIAERLNTIASLFCLGYTKRLQ